MLANGGYGQSIGKADWPIKQSAGNTKESTRVLRKFINSAIYVEKPVSCVNSNESVSVSQNVSIEDLAENKTKRCTCSVDQKTCESHFNSSFTVIPKEEKRKTAKVPETKTKVSQNCKAPTEMRKTHEIRSRPKKEHDKRKGIEIHKLAEAQMKEKQKIIEQERNNFKKWLMEKKKLEMVDKKKKEQELENMQLKELEREKRELENELNFQLWLKKKEDELLERKIKKQMEVIERLERKESKSQQNEKAFNEWLQNSKSRQKPVPLNKGIHSLRCSSSVTYINPNPWHSTP